MVNLANGIAELGYPTDMVLFERSGTYLDQLHPSIRIVDLGVSRALWAAKPLSDYFEREQPKAVLGAMEHVNAAIYQAWKKHRDIVFVPTIRNHISQEAKGMGLKKRIEFFLARQAYLHAHFTAAVSQGVADDAEAVLHLPKGLIKVIYNPVITPDLLEDAQKEPEHPWFKDRSTPIILGVGRLAPQKDFGTLMDAAAVVRESQPVRLLILGEGDERATLEQKIESMNAGSWISMPGFAKNPFSVMKNADLFVLSSKFEGLPGVLIQAMATGCPVVSTDCPSGPMEILKSGKYGRLVPVGDSQKMAGAILESLKSPIQPPKEALEPFFPDAAVSTFLEAMGLGPGLTD